MCLEEKSEYSDFWYGIELSIIFVIALTIRNGYDISNDEIKQQIDIVMIINSIFFSYIIYHFILMLLTVKKNPNSEYIHKAYWVIKIIVIIYMNIFIISFMNKKISNFLSNLFFWMGSIFMIFQVYLVVEASCLWNKAIIPKLNTNGVALSIVLGSIVISIFLNVGLFFLYIFDSNSSHEISDWKVFVVIMNFGLWLFFMLYSTSKDVLNNSDNPGLFIISIISIFNAFQIWSMLKNSDDLSCLKEGLSGFENIILYSTVLVNVASVLTSALFHGQNPEDYWMIHLIYIFVSAYAAETLVNWDMTNLQLFCVDMGMTSMYVKLACVAFSYFFYYNKLKQKRDEKTDFLFHKFENEINV